MIKILFVCHGNICRSPMAEFVCKDFVARMGLADEFYIESAATSSEEIWNGVGNPVYPPAREKLASVGISCKGKRARQLTKADYDRFDYLIAMEQMNIRNMMRIIGTDPENKVFRLLDFTDKPGDIADPWYTGNFDLTYDEIVIGTKNLLSYIQNKNNVVI